MDAYDPQDPRVGVALDPTATYGARAPFDPPEPYPEYPFARGSLDPANGAYRQVREAFRVLGLDAARFGTSDWNPLGHVIRRGDRVVIKPNAVLDYNQEPGESVFASITHPSVLRAVIDYCWIALRGQGELIIADAPLMSADFAAWCKVMQLEAMIESYRRRGVTLAVVDLRETTVRWMLGFTPSVFRRVRQRDPLGYTDIDLGARSCLAPLGETQLKRAYGADYRVSETLEFHRGGRHAYRVANTVLAADVLVSVPKLKLHKKVGVTLAIKGMVGIIGDKNSIVHHRRGAPADGGDEYPASLPAVQQVLHDWRTALITRIAAKQTLRWDALYLFAEVMRRGIELLTVPRETRGRLGGGSWSGNDTAWRMGCDLLRIALYGRAGQASLGSQRRRTFAVIDGIVGGDLHGPLAPRARHAGVIVAGANAVAVDWVGARLMNADPLKLKLLASSRAAADLSWVGDAFPVVCSDHPGARELWSSAFHLDFEAAPGWRGEIEAVP